MEHTVGTEKTGSKGNWLVILGGFGRYIVQTNMSREEVREMQSGAGGVLVATDAFEFTSQLQMGQAPHPQDPRQMVQTVGKLNIVYRADASCYPLAMEFALAGTLLYWLDDLNQSDASVYKDLIKQAITMGDGWAKQRAAATSGVTLASSIPAGVPQPGGFRA